MSTQYAGVMPYQPWLTPGHAHAAILPPSQHANDCDVPDTKPDPPGDYIILKSDHHHGLVIVNKNLPPATTTATLRLIVEESQANVTLGSEENGVVVLFRPD